MVGLTLTLAFTAGTRITLAPADSSPTLWYVTRTLGVAAYVSLSVSVMLGIVRTIARRAREGVSWRIDELHQFVATLSVLMIAGHLLALRYDTFLPFSWANLLLPFNEPYRPLAVQIGILALYAVAATVLTSWLRRWIGYGTWRTVHYLSFVAFALVTLHGWLAGSDSAEPWMRAIYVGCAAAIAFLTLVRYITGRTAAHRTAPLPAHDSARSQSAFGPHT